MPKETNRGEHLCSPLAVLPAAGAVAAASAPTAEPLAADDGDHYRHAGCGNGYGIAADRTGICRVVFAAAAASGSAVHLLDFVLTGDKACDDQRLVNFRAAACAQGEGFAAGVARAGDADGKRPRRAALVAARLKQNLMDDEGRAIVVFRIAEMHRIA